MKLTKNVILQQEAKKYEEFLLHEVSYELSEKYELSMTKIKPTKTKLFIEGRYYEYSQNYRQKI